MSFVAGRNARTEGLATAGPGDHTAQRSRRIMAPDVAPGIDAPQAVRDGDEDPATWRSTGADLGDRVLAQVRRHTGDGLPSASLARRHIVKRSRMPSPTRASSGTTRMRAILAKA